MPKYGTVGGVQSLFPPISSVTNLTSAVIAKYLDNTEAEINARITKRYNVPVTPSSPGVSVPLLVAITERETVYRISVQRGLVQFPPAQQGQSPLAIQHRDDQALIDKIVEGEIALVDDTGNEIVVDTTQILVYSSTKDYLPTFKDGLPYTDSVIDEDKSDDAINERIGRGL